MQQSGRRQPGHERGVLDRVPEPPAAPAQLVIGPIAARRDAERQEDPARQHPGPHGAGQRRVDVPGQHRPDGQAEGDRQADIAEVEGRRVEGQARVLQQRVEAPALRRRRVEPRERVRGEQQEGVEAEAQRRLRAEAGDQHLLADAPLEQGQGRARQRQHRHPQQHRAFVISPRAGELVEPGLGAVAVGGDQCDAEVGAQEDRDQSR